MVGAKKKRAVIATSRPWDGQSLDRLQQRTGYEFTLLSNPEELTPARLSAISPRFVFFPHWSQRIPAEIHKQYECVIFHMTDLPFGRGGSPLQNLIVRGIYETKISAVRCVEELDAGPVYLKRHLSLHGAAEEIYLRAYAVVADMIVDIIERQPAPTPQEGEPTYFKRRTPEEGNLASVRTLDEAYDVIRMLDAIGYPNAFVRIGPFKIEFSRASRKADGIVAEARISIASEVQNGK
jgi:methionyl-tRNA formyltransferase